MLSVQAELSGKHLVVTGVTGFLAKVWVAMLLEHVPEVRRITLIVRPKRRETAQARVERILSVSPAFRPLRLKYGADYAAFLREKIDVVSGDMQAPGCGLSESVRRSLLSDVDVVVNVAGLTDFEPDPAQALATNVLGAVHAADLAAQSKGQRLVHVSTCFVAGNISGRVAEQIVVGSSPGGLPFDVKAELDWLQKLCDSEPASARSTREAVRLRTDAALRRAESWGWPNIYTYTKALAEHLLASRIDVDTTVVRPSIVECAVDFPFEGWNEGINTSGPLFWLLGSFFRAFPSRPDYIFDVVPVDDVARAMLVITAACVSGRADGVYQVGSSDTNPMTFGRAIELTGLAMRESYSDSQATAFERRVLRVWDAVPVSQGLRDVFSIDRQRRCLGLLGETTRTIAQRIATLAPKMHSRRVTYMADALSDLSAFLNRQEIRLGRVSHLLRLYKPFIHDNDYVFEAKRVRQLVSRLSPKERSIYSLGVDRLSWRDYWVNVEGQGLKTWCFPLLRGQRAPEDPAPLHPVSLSHKPVRDTNMEAQA